MKNKFLLTLSFMVFFVISCNDDDQTNPNNNNNGGGNNSTCTGGPSTVTDIDGNIYNVVTIGNLCWMKENLKTTKYRNGNPIPTNLSDTQWETTTSGAMADYDNNTANTSTYGKLYNWYAVTDPRGLCPTGWHVPSEAEWNSTVLSLDPAACLTCDGFNYSTSAGGKLKTTGTLEDGTGLWTAPNSGATNSTGFGAVPAGWRTDDGVFFFQDVYGSYWTSTEYSSLDATMRTLACCGKGVANLYNFKTYGISVRCVRD